MYYYMIIQQSKMKESTMELVKVKHRGQVTIPHSLRKKLNISEGDYIKLDEVENGLVLRPVKVIDSDQEYFYTKEWQEEEARVDKEIAKGKVSGPFKSVDDLITELES